MMAIMIDVMLYLIVWICISLVISDGEHLFMCLFIYMSYLDEGLFKSSAYFLVRLCVFFCFVLFCFCIELYKQFAYLPHGKPHYSAIGRKKYTICNNIPRRRYYHSK